MAGGSLDLRVVTPERPIFEGPAEFVVVPAHDGEVGILPGHARLLATLGVGELRVRTSGGPVRLFVDGGFLQVADDRVTVLCDRAVPFAELDVAAAEAEARAAAVRRALERQPAGAH
jgi:F-type H+-transporting ATPase subunit epsilon